MRTLVGFAVANYSLTLFVLGLLASAISLVGAKGSPGQGRVAEALFSYFLLFSIGIGYFYNFVIHVFFGQTAARFIGWADSPFQTEVGFASLGFAVIGLLAFRGSHDLRTAAVVGPSCFLLGAAAGHIVQIVRAHNFAPGNAGVILYTDVVIPVFGLTLLWLERKRQR